MSVHVRLLISFIFFFFKQQTAYEMRISDWSSDVCSSDLKIRFKTWKVRGKPSPDGQPRLAVPHPLGLDAPATPPDEERGCRWALAAGRRRRQGSDRKSVV